MKTNDFFLKKAHGFKNELQEMVIVPFSGSIINDIYGETREGDNTEFDNQRKDLQDITFQISLLFLESNSPVFVSKLEESEVVNAFNRSHHDNSLYVKQLIRIIDLFIGFWEEYRMY